MAVADEGEEDARERTAWEVALLQWRARCYKITYLPSVTGISYIATVFKFMLLRLQALGMEFNLQISHA